MRHPSRQEREALLELLLALGGPLVWTGPIPYDALRARHDGEHHVDPLGGPVVPAQRAADHVADGEASAGAELPPVAGSCAA